MMRKVILWIVLAVTASMMFAAFAAEEDLSGTYRLVSNTRKILDTGEVINTYGEQPPKGYIMYGRDGRMLALIVRGDRPKPKSIEKTTNE